MRGGRVRFDYAFDWRVLLFIGEQNLTRRHRIVLMQTKIEKCEAGGISARYDVIECHDYALICLGLLYKCIF